MGMVMNKREALLTCIETFKILQEFHPHLLTVLSDVLKRCEDALAIPEAEPYCWLVKCFGEDTIHYTQSSADKFFKDYVLDGGTPVITKLKEL